MRRLLVIACVLGLPAAAKAQETYSLNATAGQVTDLTLIVANENERTCTRFGQAVSCTQAQACTAANAAGGAACTAAQARAANARIFPATLAGREEFVTFNLLAPRFQDAKGSIVSNNHGKMCGFWATASRGAKDTVCTNAGNAAGCELCPQ